MIGNGRRMYIKTTEHRRNLSLSAKKAHERMSPEKKSEKNEKISKTLTGRKLNHKPDCGCGVCEVKRNRIPREMRICTHPDCSNTFEVRITSSRKYCSTGCSRRAKLSLKHKEKICQALMGHIVTDETKEKQRVAGIGKYPSEEAKKKMRDSHVGIPQSKEHVGKRKVLMEEHWADPETKEKHLKAIFKGLRLLPNKPEKLIIILLQRLFPDLWRYAGDGKDGDSIVAGKSPDFIHTRERKIIEFFGDFWHGESRTGISNKQHEKERIDLFAQHGYQTLVIWEYELEDIEKVKDRLIVFNGR